MYHGHRGPDLVFVKGLFVAYEDEDMREKAEKVLDHIIWLLEEEQEPMEASQSREREIKG